MDLDGEKTGAYGLSLPMIISVRIQAAAMEDVIPHLLNPVATNRLGVFFEYLPTYGIPSRVIQS